MPILSLPLLAFLSALVLTLALVGFLLLRSGSRAFLFFAFSIGFFPALLILLYTYRVFPSA